MKAKKAVKRLNKAEALLSNVIDQFPASEPELGELLASAKAAVIRARETVNAQSSSPAAKRSPSGTATAQQARVTANGRQKPSPAAANRRIPAKRNSMNAVARRRLKKTA